MAELSPKQHYLKHLGQLKNERTSFEEHWRELAEFIDPRSTRFLTTERNNGSKRNTRIVDPTASKAARTLQSGMLSGITSPTRPWFKLATPDPEMMQYGPVKRWLDVVMTRMNDVMNRSNVYQSLPIIYRHLGVFGTAAMAVLEDDEDVIRTHPLPIGSYYLSNSHRLSVDTTYRVFSMTARQIVMQFGLDNVSNAVRGAWDNANYEAWFDVVHLTEPNIDRVNGKLNSRNKAFKSVYFELSGDGDKLLREAGFDEPPILSPRWEINGEDVYGSNCPGMMALGTGKALQMEQIRKANAIDKLVNPPMVAPTGLKNKLINLAPGGVTYVDEVDATKLVRPAYAVSPQLNDMLGSIADDRQMIEACFFSDLFNLFSTINTRSMPVEAVAAMQDEKLLQLGPVLERLNDEFLDPFVDRTFNIMARRNLFPEPPEELQGTPLKVEYVSILAQAQKSIGISSVERFVGFVGNLAKANPAALDKLNIDQTIDEYGNMLGVPATIVNSDDEVQATREQRAQMEQQQQMMAMAQQAGATAKTLSDTNTADPSLLKTLSDAAQQPAVTQ